MGDFMKVIKISAVWCPGCLIMHSRWNKIGSLYPNLKQIDYDYDIDEAKITKYNVGDKLPVYIFENDNNEEIIRVTGEKTIDELKKIIEEI